MPNAMNFATRLILKESAMKLMEDEETMIDKEEEVVEQPIEEVETEVQENTDEFQESIDDLIFFCASCNKHFIATKDTPEDMICCPVCDDRELIVNVGSAEQALQNPENEEVAEELEDMQEKEEPEEVQIEEEEVEDEDIYFDESGLEESLKVLASNYSGLKECKVKIVDSYMKEGKMIVNGRLNGKPFGMILEGLDLKKKTMVLEGTCNMLPKCKVKVAAMLEGKVLKTGRLGYGLLHESRKIRGIVKR